MDLEYFSAVAADNLPIVKQIVEGGFEPNIILTENVARALIIISL